MLIIEKIKGELGMHQSQSRLVNWVPVRLGASRTGCQSDWVPSRTGTSHDWDPVRLGPSPTGTGACLGGTPLRNLFFKRDNRSR